MAGRRLTRWQKASAVVPMAVLVGAWGAALAGPGSAVGLGESDSNVPDVPDVAISQPATVEGEPGIDPQSGVDGALSTLSTNGIPSVALVAYRRAETLLAQADPTCNLPWNLVAAIGRVESNHGRIGGSSLAPDGTAVPGIYGIALDGTNGTARIPDTDNGRYDNDPVWDRAVGPMQFIPSTWETVGLDANGDGLKDPQNIHDAAVAAGVYLCAGDGDLSDRDDAADALFRYNRSSTYVSNVLAISDAYAAGDFTSTPDGFSAAPVLTARENDRTLTAAQREQARQDRLDREQAAQEAAERGEENTPAPTNPTTPSPQPGGGNGGGNDAPAPKPTPAAGVTGLVDSLASPDPLGQTLTWAEARVLCLTDGLSTLDVLGLTKCITDLLG